MLHFIASGLLATLDTKQDSSLVVFAKILALYRILGIIPYYTRLLSGPKTRNRRSRNCPTCDLQGCNHAHVLCIFSKRDVKNNLHEAMSGVLVMHYLQLIHIYVIGVHEEM